MNDDELIQNRDRGDEVLARRLEAYAAERLTPDASASTRMRAQVMAAAHRQATAAPTPLHLAQRRRLVGAFLAASLTVGLVVGSASASQAGGPLYPVRIWAETLTLPSSPSERATAEVRRLEARLAEAFEASAAGDQGAADAALEAYGNIVGSAIAVLTGDRSSCEFAITVASEFGGVGLVTAVMTTLIDEARRRGLKEMEGFVLTQNQPMLGLARRLGFSIKSERDDPTVRVCRMTLDPL